MKRRSMLRLTCGAALGTALPASAQPQRMMRLGVLVNQPPSAGPGFAAYWQSFTEDLRHQGWEEGRNLIIEWRYANNDPHKYRVHAEELVAAGVDLIYAPGDNQLEAASKAHQVDSDCHDGRVSSGDGLRQVAGTAGWKRDRRGVPSARLYWQELRGFNLLREYQADMDRHKTPERPARLPQQAMPLNN